MASTNTFSGHGNQGFQLASNSGHVHVNLHGQPDDASPTKPNPSSTVPFRRDPDFVDRDILAEVSQKCSKPASRAALVGLGGVGKSQLAIEYSWRIREQSPQTWIFWVHASNAARFEAGYRMIANKIKLPRRDEPSADILRWVSDWLSDEANGQWIMILDNADDPTVLSDPRKERSISERLKSDLGELAGGAVSLSTFIPQTPNGSVLVTSRSEDAALRLIGRHQDIIKVEPMDEDRALLLFEKKLRGGFDKFDKGDSVELVRALDYMPLAISQAAAFINQAPRTTVAKYLSTFRKNEKQRLNLLNRDKGDLRRDGEASNSIITTWQISFERIRETRPSAARLLSLMSFFDRQGIPESLLHDYDDIGDNSNTVSIERADEDDTDVDLDNDNDMRFEDDVSALTDYSLITTNLEDDHFEMHRLVQLSTRAWLDLKGELEKWKKKFITRLWEAFPTRDYENWPICQELFPHAEALLGFQPAEREYYYLKMWCSVIERAGQYVSLQGNYMRAEEMTRRSPNENEKVLGKEHPDLLMSVNSLALVLRDQAKYEAAEEILRRALDGKEKVLGKEHRVTLLLTINNLATVLWKQGRGEAVEEMVRRALDMYEKVLGKEHPITLIFVNNLAMVLQEQGKYEVAEEMIRRALDGTENVLGKEHPDTLECVNNLATVLWNQRKYDAAEEMIRRALDGREKVLGKEHPKTSMCVNNLAMVLWDQGKCEAAEELTRQALDGTEKALGKEHPDTLSSFAYLPILLKKQGNYEAAAGMILRALDGNEKVLGMEHPVTLLFVYNLLMMLRVQGNYQLEEESIRRELDGMEKLLGKEHPDLLRHVSSLALVLLKQEKYEAAEETTRRALDGHEKALGKEHPETLMYVNNLAMILQEQGKYETAEKMMRHALDGHEKVLGEEHPTTLTCVYDLAKLLRAQGKYEAAEEMARRALDGREKALGREHPDTMICVTNLATLLQKQGKHEAAEEMIRRAMVLQGQGNCESVEELVRRKLEGLEKVLGKDEPERFACARAAVTEFFTRSVGPRFERLREDPLR